MGIEIISLRKYSIEIKQSAKRKWYIGSIRINSDNEKELEKALDEACDIAIRKLDFIDRHEKKKSEEIGEEEDGLFLELKALRQRTANVEKMPAYVIFHDSTLREMVKMKPISKKEFIAIKGCSESKFEKYGADFLNLIKSYRDDKIIRLED